MKSNRQNANTGRRAAAVSRALGTVLALLGLLLVGAGSAAAATVTYTANDASEHQLLHRRAWAPPTGATGLPPAPGNDYCRGERPHVALTDQRSA